MSASNYGAAGLNVAFASIPHTLTTSGVSSGAFMAYAVLLQSAYGPGGEYFRGIKHLADTMGINEKTARGYLRQLEEVGAITNVQRGKCQRNLVTINDWSEITWIDRGDRALEPIHTRKEAPLALECDRAPAPIHTESDRAPASGVIGHQSPFHREEESLRKNPLRQEESLREEEEERAREQAFDGPEEEWWMDGDFVCVQPYLDEAPLQDAFEKIATLTSRASAMKVARGIHSRTSSDSAAALRELEAVVG